MIKSWKNLFGAAGLLAGASTLLGVFTAIVAVALGSYVLAVAALAATLAAILAFTAAGLRSVIYRQRTTQRNLTTRVANLNERTSNLQASLDRDAKVNQKSLDLLRGDHGRFGNSIDSQGPYRGVGVDYMLAQRSYRAAPNLASFALQTSSYAMRDVLSLAATAMRYRSDELLTLLRVWQGQLIETGALTPLADDFDPRGILDLASVIEHQQSTPLDQQDASNLFHFARTLWGLEPFTRTHRFLALEAVTATTDPSTVRKKAAEFGLEREWQQIRLIRANQELADDLADTLVSKRSLHPWLESVNEVFTSAALERIDVRLGEFRLGDLLDHLVPAAHPERPLEADLVSVIMPTYRPNHALITAVRSVLNQTYQNIEVLVVDDGSGSDYDAVFESVMSLSPRVQVLRQAANKGAYAARNAGLRASSGNFVTVHDDDDWSHPQKIEQQVSHLLDNPEVPANMSSHVRLSEDGRFVRINANPILSQPNYSSLMVRRSVIETLGPWQELRRGADSEFKERIDHFFGEKIPTLTKSPLSFTRTAPGNLTSGEIHRGYISGDRRWFGLVHREMHAAMSAGDLELEAATDIHPATPLRLLPRAEEDLDFDVVYCTDYRFPGGTTALAVAELQLLADEGAKIGLLQLDSPVNAPTTPLAPRVLDFLESNPEVSVLALPDEVQTELMIVRQPGVVEYAENLTSRIRAKKGVLIANTTPVFAGGENVAFNLPRCTKNFIHLFGVQPKVYPESPVTRELLEKLGYGPLLDKEDWLGMAPAQFRPTGEYRIHSGRPRVGRHGRDHSDKWPDDVGTLGMTFFNPKEFDTAILGGISEIPYPVPAEMLSATDVIEFGEADPVSFLQSLDFFVHYPSSNWKESFGMATVEALATGVVCLLPPYMSTVFGDAALYAEPEEMVDVLAATWADPEAYRAQVERGFDFVEKNFRGRHVIHAWRNA